MSKSKQMFEGAYLIYSGEMVLACKMFKNWLNNVVMADCIMKDALHKRLDEFDKCVMRKWYEVEKIDGLIVANGVMTAHVNNYDLNRMSVGGMCFVRLAASCIDEFDTDRVTVNKFYSILDERVKSAFDENIDSIIRERRSRVAEAD